MRENHKNDNYNSRIFTNSPYIWFSGFSWRAIPRDTNQYIAEQYIAAIYWYCQYQYQYQYWFFKNCNINININIELVLAIYWQYIDRAIYCQFRAIYCRNRAIYCSLFGRWENFLDDFSRFFIFRFRLTENVKSESVFV